VADRKEEDNTGFLKAFRKWMAIKLGKGKQNVNGNLLDNLLQGARVQIGQTMSSLKPEEKYHKERIWVST